MAKYRVTSPDGVTFEVTAPDDATPEQVQAYAAANMPKSAPPAPMNVDPTEGMSTFEKGAAGLGKAIVDTGRGIAGLFGADNRAEIEESRRLDKSLMNTGAGVTGNIIGHVGMALAPGGILKGAGAVAGATGAGRAATALNSAGNAVLAPKTIKGAAGLGAGVGVAQPAVDWTERVGNAGMGAAAGAGGQALFRGAARVIRPNTAPEVTALMQQGVTPTPGQILGGGFKRVEEGLTSVPIVGDAIKGAQRRAFTELNTAAFNRALEPVGMKLPKGLEGRAAVDFVEDALGNRYNQLLPKMTTRADQQFAQQVNQVRQMVRTGSIDPRAAAAFDRIMKGDVLGKFKGQNAITGQTLKDIEGDLGATIRRLGQSTDADQRLVADALTEVQSALRDLVMRSNPQFAQELKAINTGWANFKRVQRAAASVGSDAGVFTPAQLQNAVKAMDKSKDKGRFARGDALMQDLSEPGKQVLGNTVPDSGTPFRTMAALLAGGAAGGMAGPGAAAAALAGPALYSRPGQQALAAILARRPQAAEPVSNALLRFAPYATAPALGFSNQ